MWHYATICTSCEPMPCDRANANYQCVALRKHAFVSPVLCVMTGCSFMFESVLKRSVYTAAGNAGPWHSSGCSAEARGDGRASCIHQALIWWTCITVIYSDSLWSTLRK